MENKYTFCICLSFFVILLISSACSKQAGVKDILVRTENIVEQQPDSALHLLQSVLFPENWNKSRQNKYYLLLIEAKDKDYKDITSDTLIFSVKEYYLQKKDYPNAALAAYYCGRLWHERNNADEAASAYSEAEKLAGKTDNNNLKGLIQSNWGILNREHSSYVKAIELLKNAVGWYRKSKNYKNEIESLRLIGDCFGLSKKMDSAFNYYNESLKLAILHNIPKLQADVKNDIAVTFQEQGSFLQAKQFYNEALILSNDSLERARILLNIAQVYGLENDIDSLNYYLDKALSLNASNPWLIRSSYFLKSKIAEKNNRFQEALNDYKEYHNYTTKVFDSEKNNKLLEIQGKYDYEKLKNVESRLTIKLQRTLLILALTLFIAGIIIFIYYRKYSQKEKLTSNLEEKIKTLQNIATDFSKEKQTFRNIVVLHFEVMKKTALLESEIPEDERKSGKKLLKKFNKIVYGQDSLDWSKLYLIMNSLYDGLYDEIKKKYPQWDEMDFRIFCMSNENQFNDNEIALILNTTIPMIRKIRSKIRKDMGIPKYSHDFIPFLKENTSNFL